MNKFMIVMVFYKPSLLNRSRCDLFKFDYCPIGDAFGFCSSVMDSADNVSHCEVYESHEVDCPVAPHEELHFIFRLDRRKSDVQKKKAQKKCKDEV